MRKRHICALALLLVVTVVASGCNPSVRPQTVKSALTFQRYASVGSNADDFRRLFEKEPTVPQLRELSEAKSRAEAAGFQVLRRVGDETIAERFLAEYEQQCASSVQVCTIVGHNDGGTLRFPDGSGVNIDSLGQIGSGSITAVIACESRRYVQGHAVGIPTDVTYGIALRTEELFTEKLRTAAEANAVIDITLAQGELLSALNQAAHERQVRIAYYSVGGVGTGVTGIAIYETT